MCEQAGIEYQGEAIEANARCALPQPEFALAIDRSNKNPHAKTARSQEAQSQSHESFSILSTTYAFL
jgi:hypothetical protein